MFIKFLINSVTSSVKNNKKLYESYIYDEWLKHKKLFIDYNYNSNLNKSIQYPKDLLKQFSNFGYINYKSGRSVIYANHDSKKYILKFDFISTVLLEYLIGYNVVNKLADIIPTFIHTHSLSFIKGEPIFIDGFPSFHLCKPYELKDITKKTYDDTQAMIILDYIEGDCLASQVKNLSQNDLSLIILNVFLSLKIAFEKFHFTHWDLHTENILLKKHNENSYLYNQKRYKIGKYLPVIFDYGLSAATINNSRIETFERLNNGMNPKWVSKFTDVWKFLVSLTYDCWYHDKYDHYNFLKKFIIKFFFPSLKSSKFLKFILTSSNKYCFFKQNKFFNKSFDDLINTFVEHTKSRDINFEWICDQNFELQSFPPIIHKSLSVYDVNHIKDIIKNNDILKLFLLPYFHDKIDNEYYLIFKKYLKYDPLDLLDKLRNEHIVIPDL
jgi:hypothetical protein